MARTRQGIGQPGHENGTAIRCAQAIAAGCTVCKNLKVSCVSPPGLLLRSSAVLVCRILEQSKACPKCGTRNPQRGRLHAHRVHPVSESVVLAVRQERPPCVRHTITQNTLLRHGRSELGPLQPRGCIITASLDTPLCLLGVRCAGTSANRPPWGENKESTSDLNRYLWYFERYFNHSQSGKVAERQVSETQHKMDDLAADAGMHVRATEVTQTRNTHVRHQSRMQQQQ